MSALSIQPTYPIFTETDGLPLENGYIWIGTANLDPQGNPINVYWDAALTQPAGQPIRTINGYPSRSGTPARLYVNSNYSIRVQNSKGSFVYSAPAATERYSDAVVSGIDAENVLYTAPRSTAVQTNQENFNSRYISVKDFGAVGDGVANDTVAIQNAIDNFIGEGCLFFPQGIYVITSPILVNKRLWIKGDNSFGTTIKNNGTGDALQFTNTWYQRISNIRIEGNGSSRDGIRLETSHFVMEDVWCASNGRHGFFIKPDVFIVSVINSTFFQNGGDGANVVADNFVGGQINDIQFLNCGFWFNAVSGLQWNVIAGSTKGCFFESNADFGQFINGTSFQVTGPIIVDGCYFEQNPAGGLSIYAGNADVNDVLVTGNYFFIQVPDAGAAHILGAGATGKILGLTVENTNNYYSPTGIPHVDLNNALMPKYGRQSIQTTQSGDTADWTFFYKNIGYAPVETYQRRTSVFGRTGSVGAWTYPNSLYSSNIISLGAGAHVQEYEFPLTSGNTYIQTGIYVDTDSTDFNLIFLIEALQATTGTKRSVTTQSFLNRTGSGLRQMLDLSDLTSINNGRVLSGEVFILNLTVVNNDGLATTLRVSNPFVRYME